MLLLWFDLFELFIVNTLKQPLKFPQQSLKITQTHPCRTRWEIGSADGGAEADKGPNHVS